MFVLQIDVLLLDEVVFLNELFVFLEELIILLAFFGEKMLELLYGLLEFLDLFAGLLVVGVVRLEGDFFGKRELFWAWF